MKKDTKEAKIFYGSRVAENETSPVSGRFHVAAPPPSHLFTSMKVVNADNAEQGGNIPAMLHYGTPLPDRHGKVFTFTTT